MIDKKKLAIIVGVISLEVLIVIMIIISIRSEIRESGVENDDSQGVNLTVTPGLSERQDDTPPLNEEGLSQTREYLVNNAPDVYVKNFTPVEQDSFTLNATFEETSSEYVFIITPKVSSLQQVQNDVLEWLATIGLSDEQISRLSVSYSE